MKHLVKNLGFSKAAVYNIVYDKLSQCQTFSGVATDSALFAALPHFT
jgi:hypothetical protein